MGGVSNVIGPRLGGIALGQALVAGTTSTLAQYITSSYDENEDYFDEGEAGIEDGGSQVSVNLFSAMDTGLIKMATEKKSMKDVIREKMAKTPKIKKEDVIYDPTDTWGGEQTLPEFLSDDDFWKRIMKDSDQLRSEVAADIAERDKLYPNINHDAVRKQEDHDISMEKYNKFVKQEEKKVSAYEEEAEKLDAEIADGKELGLDFKPMDLEANFQAGVNN